MEGHTKEKYTGGKDIHTERHTHGGTHTRRRHTHGRTHCEGHTHERTHTVRDIRTKGHSYTHEGDIIHTEERRHKGTQARRDINGEGGGKIIFDRKVDVFKFYFD